MMKSRFFSESDYQKYCDLLAPAEEEVDDLRSTMQRGKAKIVKPIKMDEFTEKVDSFYNYFQKIKSNIPKTTKLKTTNELLDNNFIVGESHQDVNPKKWLIENMSKLKQAGYSTFYFEHLYYDDQKLLDDYFEKGEMHPKLKERLKNLDNGWGKTSGTKYWDTNNFTALIKAARDAGIRVVAIDIRAVYETQNKNPGLQSDSDSKLRYQFMNFTATNIIKREEEKKPKPEKWFALMGNSHVNECDEVPGVSELTGARSVFIFDSDKPKSSEKIVPADVKLNSSVTLDRHVFAGDLIINGSAGADMPTFNNPRLGKTNT